MEARGGGDDERRQTFVENGVRAPLGLVDDAGKNPI